MKSVVWWSIGLLFGLSLVALGLFGTGDPHSKVLCGSEEMRPGQTCDRTQYGLTTTETYEEKRQEAIDSANSFNGGGRWVTFGIGAGIAALCGWRLVIAIRRQASGSVVRGVPGQQVGFGPPPESGPVAEPAPGQPTGFAPQPGSGPVAQPAPGQPTGFAPQPGSGPVAQPAPGQPTSFAPPPGYAPQGFQPQAFPVRQDFPQQPGFAPAQGTQEQAGFAPPQGFQQQSASQQPGFAPPPGTQQQPGFAPPQGVQQAPPPGYQPSHGPYQP